jgi:Holliday junction resolvase RusA-like endonuclease
MTDLFEGLNEIMIVMHGDPVAKGRPRFSPKTGTVFTPAKTARYEDKLGYAAQSVMAGRALLIGALDVRAVIYKSIPVSKKKVWKADALAGRIRPTTKPDWDNFGKILDALNKVVWVDDSQIVDGRVQKFYSEQPRIEIYVKEIGPAA